MTKMRWLLVVCAFLCVAVSAHAQGGWIALFSDANGLDCDLHDNTPGLCTYYVLHIGTPGATASQFAAPRPSCHMGAYLSDTAVFPVTIGNSQTGVAIGYGACFASPIHILSISFFCQGLTPECCFYDVVPDPNVPSGQIEVVDCNENLSYGLGGTSPVNPNEWCCCMCTPVEDSTWGRVKSLYGN